MARVLQRPQAEADLDDLWEHIAEANPDAADKVLDAIAERCTLLAQFPMLGTSRDELFPALRSLAVGSYVIFYLPLDDGIDVIRVLHGRRDIESLF